MKKLLAILLALTTLLGLCACGGGGAQYQTEYTEDGRMIITVGTVDSANVIDLDNNVLTNYIEEKCNVELKFEVYDSLEAATQVNAAIGARQQIPDLLVGIKLGWSTGWRYGNDGYYTDLTPYLEDEEGASETFWKRMEALNEDDYSWVLDQMYDPDTGKVYGIPMVETSLIDTMRYMMWINTEWLERLNLDMPTDPESLYTVLKAFKENDCNGNGDKTDEIPLFGSRVGGFGGDVVSWLMNMFVYWEEGQPWIIDENGKLEAFYMTEEYRQGLSYVNKLYEEELLTSLAWSASLTEMKQINTPSDGVPICGIFAGHLSMHVRSDQLGILEQYEPLPTWGYARRRRPDMKDAGYINGEISKEKQDKCFEILMQLWTEEGSMLQRYGEKGVNWTDPDAGETSSLGLPAEYKILTPVSGQHSIFWGGTCRFIDMCEMETAQKSDPTTMDAFYVEKEKMHAEQNQLFTQAEQNNNPKKVIPALIYTKEEHEQWDTTMTNLGDRYRKAATEFMMGVMDPDDPTAWQKFKDQMVKLGYQDHKTLAQTAYDRQLNNK